MLNASDVMKSPAAPSAAILYGIVFLFAIAYYLNIPWKRAYTITFYVGVFVWSSVVVYYRFKEWRPSPNRIDSLFVAFLATILLSAAINWWEGTIQYLKLMPVFFLAPYLLGRSMRAEDGYLLRNILIVMGILLMPQILPEYLRILKYGYPYSDSPGPILFGQGHGVMLSGLLLSATFLSLISVLLSPTGSHSSPLMVLAKSRYFIYALLAAIVVTVGWISSRGSILAGALGVSILLLLSPSSTRRRKFEMFLVVALALTLAVAHTLQRKSNWEYYAAVLKPPATVESVAGNFLAGSSRLEMQKGSILGEAACTRIVDSVSDRWVHYQQAISLFLAKPLIGIGANHYGFYACTGAGSFPHSTLLQVFAELGVVVGVAYCALILMTLHGLMRSRQRFGSPPEKPVWSWFVAFSAMQVLIAQLNGNYFVSAGLYFVMGVAASVLDRGTDSVESY